MAAICCFCNPKKFKIKYLKNNPIVSSFYKILVVNFRNLSKTLILPQECFITPLRQSTISISDLFLITFLDLFIFLVVNSGTTLVLKIAFYVKHQPLLQRIMVYTTSKKWNFPLRVSSVNVTKSTVFCGFGHIYWGNPYWKASFFMPCTWKFTSMLNIWFKSQVSIRPSPTSSRRGSSASSGSSCSGSENGRDSPFTQLVCIITCSYLSKLSCSVEWTSLPHLPYLVLKTDFQSFPLPLSLNLLRAVPWQLINLALFCQRIIYFCDQFFFITTCFFGK